MKKILVGILLALFASGAFAGSNYNRNYNRAYGGDASASARASAGAAAIGVNRNSNSNYNRNVNRVHSSNWNHQGQFQGQGQDQLQGQLQGNVGLGSGNATEVYVGGDNYEAPKKPEVPAIAPNVVTGNPTAPCVVPVGGSGAWGGIISLGATGFVKDHGCAFGEVARRAQAQGNSEIAAEALKHMFRIVKEEAGVRDEQEKVASSAVPVYTTSDDDGFSWQRNQD